MTARFGRSSRPMILIDSKGLSSELLLISDGEFFEAPSILVIFPNSDAGIRGTSLDPAVFVCVRMRDNSLRGGLKKATT